MTSGILTGKVAIVTGAASGIARATAKAFAGEGAAVVAVDIQREGVEQTAAEIAAAGGRAIARICDVSQRDQVDAAVASTVAAFGTVDILLNAAFHNPAYCVPFAEQSENDLQVNLATALWGTWNFMQACFPYLKIRGGKVINFSSGVFTEGMPGFAAYGAAKGAIAGLVNCVCQEWGEFGININSISPAMRTAAYEELLRTSPPGTHEMFVAQNPMRRMGDPDRDAARVAVFLAGPDSDYIHGRIISVDGGRGLLRI